MAPLDEIRHDITQLDQELLALLAKRKTLSIEVARAELIRIHRAGLIEDEVLHELERDLDVEELGIMLQRGDAV